MSVLDFSNTKISLRRPLTDYDKVRRLIAWVMRGRFYKPPDYGAYVELGCGPNIRPDFYCVDSYWRPGLNMCWDITCGLPFSDQSIGGIFTEHCIEHITLGDFIRLAAELRRVLIPGASVRVVVPSLELYARHLLEKLPMPHSEDDQGHGFYAPAMSVNRIFYSHGHKFIYDFETMRGVLERVGFSRIEQCEFGKSHDPRLQIDAPERRIESLYVEAS